MLLPVLDSPPHDGNDVVLRPARAFVVGGLAPDEISERVGVDRGGDRAAGVYLHLDLGNAIGVAGVADDQPVLGDGCIGVVVERLTGLYITVTLDDRERIHSTRGDF